MNARRFELPPLGLLPRLLPMFVGLLLPLVLAMMLAWQGQTADASWRELLPALLGLPLVGAGIALNLFGRQVEVADGRIRLRRWPWPRDFPLSGINLDRSRVVDLASERGLQPVLRLMGTRVPGFRSGWFWLRDRRRAYVLASGSKRVLALERTDGSVLLVGVEKPDALLQALRDGGGAGR